MGRRAERAQTHVTNSQHSLELLTALPESAAGDEALIRKQQWANEEQHASGQEATTNVAGVERLQHCEYLVLQEEAQILRQAAEL